LSTSPGFELLVRKLRGAGVSLASIGVGLLTWLVLLLSQPVWLQRVQELALDGSWRLLSSAREERRIVLVDIDERSLQEVGQWPWPRETQARLVDALAAQAVSLQVFDIVFSSPQPGDLALARALQQYRPVLAQAFALPGQGDDTQAGALAGALSWTGCPAMFPQASGYLANQPSLLPGSHTLAAPVLAVGHITPTLSADGVIRKQPAVICFKDTAYPALAIAAAGQAGDARGWALQPGRGLGEPAWWLMPEPPVLPGLPVSADGQLRVPWWLSPQGFVSVSAADLLAGRVSPRLLEKAWVVVGASAFGLGDTVATPLQNIAAGMQVHAQLLAGIIDARLPFTPRGGPAIQALFILLGLAGLAVLVWLPRRATIPPNQVVHVPVQLFPLLALAWALPLFLGHLWLLSARAWVIDWVAPALAVLAAGVCWGILEHTRSRRERERLYKHLSSYLPAPVAAALALQPPSDAVRASTQVISVLFADIRNFSAYCEARPPEEAAAVLHAFFSTAARVVEEYGGVVESFQGDSVIAVWFSDGSADSVAHSRMALTAAKALIHRVRGQLPDPAPGGLEPLALGVGLESGPAMTGSFGLARRRTHLVMGRTVTIASRLVELTAELAHPVLVGEGLAANLGGEGLESMGTFLLEGLRVPHHIYACPLNGA
jgi:adenylate cyclase